MKKQKLEKKQKYVKQILWFIKKERIKTCPYNGDKDVTDVIVQ